MRKTRPIFLLGVLVMTVLGGQLSWADEDQIPADISEEDMDIIRELDVLENLPLLSEEDFNILADESALDSAEQKG